MSSNLFQFPSSQPPNQNQNQQPPSPPRPTTPERLRKDKPTRNIFGETNTSNRSTTPAGPAPPSLFGRSEREYEDDDPDASTASFTPAGAPSARYLGSSIMRGVSAAKPGGGQEKGLFAGLGGEQPKGLFTGGGEQPKGLFTGGGGGMFTGLGGAGDNDKEKKGGGGGLFGGVGKQDQPKGLFTAGGEPQPKGLFTGGGASSQPQGLFTGLGTTGADKTSESGSGALFGAAAEGSQPKGLFGGGNGSSTSGLFTGIGGGFDSAGGFTGGEAKKKNLFSPALGGPRRNSPLAKPAVRGPQHTRQPSRLSRAIGVDEQSPQAAKTTGKTFGVPLDDEGSEFDDGDNGDEGDMWLDLPSTGESGVPNIGDESDLLMLATPAATERVRREAEDIFRASSFQAGPTRSKEFRYAPLARDEYQRMGTAALTEPPNIILGTENLLAKLYDEGVGEAEDDDKMDDTLATVAGKVAALWKGHVDKLPHPTEEHAVTIGPGPHATSFEKAYYLANLALQIHHTRYEDSGMIRAEPLPETMFRWLNENHDMYGAQIDEILRFRPSPACHSLFWEAVFIALLRGRVTDAARLLRQAGWGHVRRDQRGEYSYSGRALENVQRAVEEAVYVLESCPGYDGNWEIWSSDWTLFRVRAQGALEHLRRFAEGKDSLFGESTFSASAASARSRQSMAGLARRAESQVPWEIYEKLNVLFDIVLGQQGAILEAAQDWLEATVGLFSWWDERRSQMDRPFGMSQSMSRSQALVLAPSQAADSDSYLERLARTFHMAVESDFHFDSQNPVEIGMACVFEENIKGVIGLLRGWSLPIAAAVAEIASLGKWLPPHQPAGVFGLEDLDMDDLEVLGVDPLAPDEIDGIKDSTLVQYGQTLADYEGLSTVKDRFGGSREGWEVSISVFGRMDSPERSEEMVRDLVEHLIQSLHVDSNDMVDRLWTLLSELGMIEFAEDTTETYGDILARDSHRYGEAMWYYALAHRPGKVREVMNLLISYSLIQSTAFPPANNLDDYLHKLLTDRKNTLEQCANQDMEAAELLGKMLSGYASLRQFYDIRDKEQALPNATPQSRRQQAATALISVIASSDDNIRGGLFDQTRDGIVSEDFLLALLGEALVFVSNPDNTNVHHGQLASPVITLDQIDILLKAVEDLQAVGSRVYTACDEFLQLVLASAPGALKGSTPADLLKKTTSGGGGGGNLMLAGSSLVASQLQKSLSGGSGALGKVAVKRGWDWRGEVSAKTKGEDVIKRLRLGLAKDLAGLWLAEADEMVW